MIYKLYIDFDGVILDTWPKFHQFFDQIDINLWPKVISNDANDEEEANIIEIFKSIKWDILLNDSEQINDSFKWLNKLIETKMFDIAILTHCNSEDEIINKKRIINDNLPGIEVIPVPKNQCKTSAVDPKGAILVDDFKGNLYPWKEAGGIAIKFSPDGKGNNDFYNISSLDQIIEIITMIEDSNSNVIINNLEEAYAE